MDYSELKAKIARSKESALDMLIMRILERGISKAEINNLAWIYDKLFDYNDLTNSQKDKIITLNYNLNK
jgi:hypothetical protein